MSWRRFVFAVDNHGDKHDRTATRELLKFCADWKPHIRVHGGDNFDFRPLRRKASKEEQRDSLLMDYAEGVEFLKSYRPQYFLRGNHDERLWDLALEDRGVISDYAIKATQEIADLMTTLHCRMLPYHKRLGIVRVGSLKMIHGFYCGITAARRTALAYGSVLMGHGHAIDHQTIEGLETRMGRMAGCLCQLDMDYNRAQIAALRHAHGWIAGVVNDKSGVYYCQQIQRIDPSRAGGLGSWSHHVFNL